MKTLFFIVGIALFIGQAQALTLPNQLPVKAYECLGCDKLSQETLSLSWRMTNKLGGYKTQNQQTSRKYLVKTSLKQLQEGVAIYTQAPGAIIRIAPVNPNQKLNPNFNIQGPQGQSLSLIEASSLFSKEEALKETAFAENTLALFELKPELGSGRFVISSPRKMASQTEEENLFIIHVFDRNASAQLSIQTDKVYYQHGDEVTATIKLQDKNQDPIDNIEVSLINPEGQSTSLSAKPIDATTFEVKFPLLSEKNEQGRNWSIEAKTSAMVNNQPLYRQVQTSFSYAIPSAAVRELTKTSADPFNFSAKIEVATGSRYALQAVLFGRDAKGRLAPIQTVQTASWLPAGENQLKFSFDPKLESNYKGPYSLGYIRLTDYGQRRLVFVYDTPIELHDLD